MVTECKRLICQTKQIWMTMSMNTLISSENRWPHTRWQYSYNGAEQAAVSMQSDSRMLSDTKSIKDTKWGYRSRWWWRLMVILVTFGVTERHGSLCSYQCGNSRGVHWSVSRRHQHRLQNNRRERVIVQSMQMGTGEEQRAPLCAFVCFLFHQRGHIHSHLELQRPRLATMNVDVWILVYY